MSTFYFYCENIQADNASLIPRPVYVLLTSKFFMYSDGGSGDSMLLNIESDGRLRSYGLENLDFDFWNSLSTFTGPVSITLSGYYNDDGSAILHALEDYIKRADDSIFRHFSYRLSYTADGGAPEVYTARMDSQGRAARGPAEVRSLRSFPAGSWEPVSPAMCYYRDSSQGEMLEALAPTLQKLAGLCPDTGFDREEFLSSQCFECIFSELPLNSAAQAQEFWKLRNEIEALNKSGDIFGLPMYIDRCSGSSLSLDFDEGPLYLLSE